MRQQNPHTQTLTHTSTLISINLQASKKLKKKQAKIGKTTTETIRKNKQLKKRSIHGTDRKSS